MHGMGGKAGVAWVATCGGGDRAVFQFRLEEIVEVEAPVVAEPEPIWGPLDARGKVFGWTKQSVSCESGQAEGPGEAPLDLGKAGAGKVCSEELRSDEGDASDGAGGWGDEHPHLSSHR